MRMVLRWGAVAGIVGSLLLAGVPHSATAQQASGSAITEGARVYGNMCGRCHNPRSPLERGDADWVVIINHMRVRGNLTGKEVRDVLAFLQATNSDPRERAQLLAGEVVVGGEEALVVAPDEPASTDAEVISRGQALIGEKACLGCHVIAGAGGQVGPSLDGAVKRRGVAFVRRKMIDPTFNNATSMMPNFGLTQEQIEALVAYLATLEK